MTERLSDADMDALHDAVAEANEDLRCAICEGGKGGAMHRCCLIAEACGYAPKSEEDARRWITASALESAPRVFEGQP